MDIDVKQEGNKVIANQKNGGQLIFEKLENGLVKTTFLNMRGVPGKWTAPDWLIDAMLYKVRSQGISNSSQALKLAYNELSKDITDNFQGSELAGRVDMLNHYFDKISDLMKVKDEEKPD